MSASNDAVDRLRPVAVGLLLAVLTLLYGYGLGGMFGLREDALKEGFRSAAETTFAGRPDAADQASRLAGRSWTYMKRAHLHANGLGASALALALLLAHLPVADRWKTLAAGGLGLGSLGYAVFWMAAAYRAPALGGTGPAKESLSWLATPSVALLLCGLLFVLWAVSTTLIRRRGSGRSRGDRP